VHPIERLRYVARSSGAPQDLLVRETAVALAAFHDDPTALVTACRRIVSRQLTSGALWWLCSRLLTAADPLDEARTAVAEIEADDTSRRLAAAIPEDTTVLVVGWQAQIAQALARRGDLDVLVVDTFGEAASLVRHLETRDVVAQEIPVAGVASAVVASGMVVAESTAFGPTGWIDVVLLISAGIVTAVPLLLYANGAKLLRLSTIGIMQYIAPTMVFLIAVFVFHEPFSAEKAVAFGLIWAALVIYSGSVFFGRRRG